MKISALTTWIIAYSIFLFGFSLFSFIFTDPNLVLSQWQPYWQFQIWLWQWLLPLKAALVWTYLLLIGGMVICYLSIIDLLKKQKQAVVGWRHWILYGLIILPIFLSYNAFSHDVFNYAFNARMIVEYGADPHQTVALNFPEDDWTRFMHNTHTTAPYGYGWTAISALPYWIGQGVFSITWLMFRVFAVLSICLMYWAIQLLSEQMTGRKRRLDELAVLFLNPLILIEFISNMHNDLWMLAPGMASIALLWKSLSTAKTHWGWFSLSIVLFALSVSIKFVTLVWLPLLLLMTIQQRAIYMIVGNKLEVVPFQNVRDAGMKLVEKIVRWLQRWMVWIPKTASFLTFIPLLTSRSQQFHPWYLSWSLVWLPFMGSGLWSQVLVVFSVSSLLRYIPWMYYGGHSPEILFYQQLMTWSIPFLFILWKMSRSIGQLRSNRVWRFVGKQ